MSYFSSSSFFFLCLVVQLFLTCLHQTSAESAVRDFECNSGLKCAHLLRREGFAVIRGAFEPALIAHVSAIAIRNSDEFSAMLVSNGILSKPLSQGSEDMFVDDPGRREGYWEIQSRGE